MQRTWYRQESDGMFFRNTGLVDLDQSRWVNKLIPWRRITLSREWEEIFAAGVTKTSALPKRDRYIEHDDSDEATLKWCAEFFGRDYFPGG